MSENVKDKVKKIVADHLGVERGKGNRGSKLY